MNKEFFSTKSIFDSRNYYVDDYSLLSLIQNLVINFLNIVITTGKHPLCKIFCKNLRLGIRNPVSVKVVSTSRGLLEVAKPRKCWFIIFREIFNSTKFKYLKYKYFNLLKSHQFLNRNISISTQYKKYWKTKKVIYEPLYILLRLTSFPKIVHFLWTFWTYPLNHLFFWYNFMVFVILFWYSLLSFKVNFK